MFIPPGIENVYPGCGFSLWSRAGNSHVLRRALSLAPANRGRGLQPHPAGGCGQVQQVTPHSAGAKKHMFCHLNLNVYSGRLGKDSSRLGLPAGGPVVVSLARWKRLRKRWPGSAFRKENTPNKFEHAASVLAVLSASIFAASARLQ